MLGQLLLGHPDQPATMPDTLANMNIHGVWHTIHPSLSAGPAFQMQDRAFFFCNEAELSPGPTISTVHPCSVTKNMGGEEESKKKERV
jgi:hypothetical protein